MIRYSVIGATGYVCGELLRMMVHHPETELMYVADTFGVGTKIQDSHPALALFYDDEIIELNDTNLDLMIKDSDVIFIVVPSGEVYRYGRKVVEAGKKLVDIGADIRFRDASVWEKWYNQEHPNPEFTKNAFYCIPEVHRSDYKGQDLISNPGCYPTATTLALYPLLKNDYLVENTIVVDAKSGYTGAGRKPGLNKLLTEAENNFCAYSLGGMHRHTPEIEQNIAYISGEDLMDSSSWQMINFQPHLLPQVRGIEVTVYASSKKDITNEELYKLYQDFYQDESFVQIYPHNKPVQTKWVYGTNFCAISASYDARTKRFIISSVIDNIGKGAAGQAIQNMNLAFGLEETTGLMVPAMYP